MTPREAAEALYKRLHVDSADFDVPQIEAFAKAQRAEVWEEAAILFQQHQDAADDDNRPFQVKCRARAKG